jgi:hypothetical protein
MQTRRYSLLVIAFFILAGGISNVVLAGEGDKTYLPLVVKPPACSVAPTLSRPQGLLNTLVPTLSWQDRPLRVISSIIEIATGPDFTPEQNYYRARPLVGSSFTRLPYNLEPATTYYWRVRFVCKDTESPNSEVWSFTTGSDGVLLPAPTLFAPPNGYVSPLRSPTLLWNRVEGAHEYIVRYRPVGATDYNYTFSYSPEPRARISELQPNTTYEWWVATLSDYGYGQDSERWTFTTGTQ